MSDHMEEIVKWFNAVKGYGFIVRDDEADMFVNFSAIQMDGCRKLDDWQNVEFIIE